MINKSVIILLSFFLFISCKKESSEYYLYRGLDGYKKTRFVDQIFLEGFGIKKIAFFNEADTLSYALLLNDDLNKEIVNNHNLGVHVYAGPFSKSEKRDFLIWDLKPKISKYGDYKYIIGYFKKSITKMDSLVFFLYDIKGYKGVDGNIIRIKNLSI